MLSSEEINDALENDSDESYREYMLEQVVSGSKNETQHRMYRCASRRFQAENKHLYGNKPKMIDPRRRAYR